MWQKLSIYIVTVIVLLFFGGCRNSGAGIQKELERIKAKWVPDSRVAIFDVRANKESGNEWVVKGETTVKAAKNELLNILAAKNITVLDSLIVLPLGISEHENWALVTLSVANLRDEPKYSAQLVSQVIMGTPLKILKKVEDWILIQCPDKYIGWTNASSLQFMSIMELNNWKNSARGIVMDDAWVLDHDNKRIADLVAGSIVEVLDESASYKLVKIPDGRQGYVETNKFGKFEQWLTATELSEEKLICTAYQFMGLPYLWGGTSSKALDCSGFVKNIFFLNSYILARDASQQVNEGRRLGVMKEGLQPGDLLFFGNTSNQKVTHVGMYIGDSEFIHCSGQVMTNSLDSTSINYSHYRKNTWLTTCRYVGQPAGDGFIPVGQHPWYVQVK